MTPAERATAQADDLASGADILVDSARRDGWVWVRADIGAFSRAEMALAVTRLGGKPAKTKAALMAQLGSLLT